MRMSLLNKNLNTEIVRLTICICSQGKPYERIELYGIRRKGSHLWEIHRYERVGTQFWAVHLYQPSWGSYLSPLGSSSSSTGEVPTKKTKTSSSRTLQVATAEGWKISSLAKFSASEWLIINADESKKYVVSMRCLTCTKYKNENMSLKGFAPQWCSVEGARGYNTAPR